MRRTAWILAVLIASLILANRALAAPHLSMPQAVAAVKHWGGQGTVLTKCKRFRTNLIGCEFYVPAYEAPEEAEENAEWADSIYRGYLNITATRHGIEVTCPAK